MRIRVYYAGGRTYEGPDFTGDNARGVQAIVQDHPEVGAEIVTRDDYYVWDNGRWRGTDIFGLFEFLLDSGLVLFGRLARREEYQEIVRQAMKDKTHWLPLERKP